MGPIDWRPVLASSTTVYVDWTKVRFFEASRKFEWGLKFTWEQNAVFSSVEIWVTEWGAALWSELGLRGFVYVGLGFSIRPLLLGREGWVKCFRTAYIQYLLDYTYTLKVI